MAKIDWDTVSSFIEGIGATDKTITFPKVQESVKVTNKGNVSVIYTIGTKTGTLAPNDNVEVKESLSSFTVRASSGTSEIYVRASEAGTEREEVSSDIPADVAVRLNDVESSLAQKATKGEISGRDLDISADANKIKLINLSDEVQQALTGNAPALSTIADGSVTIEKVGFLPFKHSKNLFNPNDKNFLTGQILNANGTISANALYSTTGFMAVNPAESIIVSRSGGTDPMVRAYAFYDVDKVWISGASSASPYIEVPITAPANAKYFRISYRADSTNLQIEIGIVATSYAPYNPTYGLSQNIVLSSSNLENGFITPIKTNFMEFAARGKNLFNHSDPDIIKGAVLNADGTLSANANYDTSGYTSVDPNENIVGSFTTGSYLPVRAVAFYDENKNFLSGQSSTSQPNNFITPNNCYYIRVTYTANAVNYQLEKGVSPTSFEAFTGIYVIKKTNTIKAESESSAWKGKKLIVNGDSIPAGYYDSGLAGYEGGLTAYPTIVSTNLKMSLVNYAIGGSTIAIKATDPTGRNPIVSRYTSMANEGDLIVIAAGTNDWYYTWTPVGTMSDRTNNTFYGALHNLCLGLLDKYISKQLLFLTPIKRLIDPNHVNGNGKTLKEYADIVKEVCGFYGIPVLDMFRECTINPSISSQLTMFIPDEVHPNRAGHEVMAKRVTGYLKQLQ